MSASTDAQQSVTSPQRRRVAVIGLGLAGCTAAHFLHKKGDEVVCFEALPMPGLYAHSVVVTKEEEEEKDGGENDIHTKTENNNNNLKKITASSDVTLCDVPLRAVSPHYYANYCRLLKYLNVPVQQVNYEGAFFEKNYFETDNKNSASPSSSEGSIVVEDKERFVFGYCNYFVPGGWALPFPSLATFKQVRVLGGYLSMVGLMPFYLWKDRVMGKLKRLLRSSPSSPTDFAADHTTMEDYFTKGHGFVGSSLAYSAEFTHGFFYPMMSTLLSCSYAQVRNYPAALLGEFMVARCTTLLTSWYRVTGGVQSVAEKLLCVSENKKKKKKDDNAARTDEAIRCLYNTYVTRVESVESSEMGARRVAVTFAVKNKNQTQQQTTTTELFDAVVVAVEPDVARRIVTPFTSQQRLLLGAAGTYTATIVAHRDASLMPRDRSRWAPMNAYGDRTESMAAPVPVAIGDNKEGSSSSSPSSPSSPSSSEGWGVIGDAGPASTTTAHFSAILAAAAAGRARLENKMKREAEEEEGKKPAKTIAEDCSAASSVNDASVSTNNVEAGLSTSTDNVNSTVGTTAPTTTATATGATTLVHNTANAYAGGDVFETWNPRRAPRPETVIKSVRMTRSVWSVAGFAAYQRATSSSSTTTETSLSSSSAQGQGGIYFAGSYCARGVTLLEQACTSGLEAAMALGAAVPFDVHAGSKPVPLNPAIVLISAGLNAALLATSAVLFVPCFVGSAVMSLFGSRGGQKKVKA